MHLQRKNLQHTYINLKKHPRGFGKSFPTIPSWMGIFHGADIVYTFGFPLLLPENFTTAADINFNKEIMTMWTNFAKTG